jgi:hypothetical protein
MLESVCSVCGHKDNQSIIHTAGVYTYVEMSIMSNAPHKKSVITNVGVRQAKARKDTIILDGGNCVYYIITRPYDVLYALRVCHFPTSQSTRISGEVSGV